MERNHRYELDDPQYGDMHLIEQGIYLGNMDAAQDKALLDRHNITKILGILDNFRYVQNFPDIQYHRIELADSLDSKLFPYLPKALKFITQARKEQKNILVHCAAGMSRSASFLIAYLMVRDSSPYESVKRFVASRRACIYPNDSFATELMNLNLEDYQQFLE